MSQKQIVYLQFGNGAYPPVCHMDTGEAGWKVQHFGLQQPEPKH